MIVFFLHNLSFVTFPNFQVHIRKIFGALLIFSLFVHCFQSLPGSYQKKLLSQGNFFLFVHCFQSVMSPCFLIIKVSSRDIFEKIFPSVDVQICWDFWKFWIWEVLEQKSFLSRVFAISRGNSVLNHMVKCTCCPLFFWPENDQKDSHFWADFLQFQGATLGIPGYLYYHYYYHYPTCPPPTSREA